MAMHSPCTVALQCTCLQGAVLGSAAQDVGSGPRQLVRCCACSRGAVEGSQQSARQHLT